MSRQLARWRGQVFSAARSFRDRDKLLLKPLPGQDAPADFGRVPGTAGVGLEVPPTELDEWWSTRTLFTWRGRQFLVSREEGDSLHATLVDVDDRWAEENGLWVVERGHARGTFARADVEELHEERTDLLASWRERTGQG